MICDFFVLFWCSILQQTLQCTVTRPTTCLHAASSHSRYPGLNLTRVVLQEPPPPEHGEVRYWNRRGFSLLPVNDLKRRHVRIDTDTWVEHLYDKLFNVDIEGLQKEAFSSLFKGGDVLEYRERDEEASGSTPPKKPKHREDVRKLRSADKGWKLGSSFTTDGVSLSLTYYNPRIKVCLDALPLLPSLQSLQNVLCRIGCVSAWPLALGTALCGSALSGCGRRLANCWPLL